MLDKPLIVQKDCTLLLDLDHPNATDVREAIIGFSDLWKSPEGLHTFRITPLSLWNAASTGMSAQTVCQTLHQHAKYGVPSKVIQEICLYMHRYGQLRMERDGNQLVLRTTEPSVNSYLQGLDSLRTFWVQYEQEYSADHALHIRWIHRGLVKQELMRLGYPVIDLAGYEDGEVVSMQLLTHSKSKGTPFSLRDYQEEAVRAFLLGGSATGGSGVVVLPCGAGKTMVGIGAMVSLGRATLILTTNTTSVKQWKREILDKTDLLEEDIGEYGQAAKHVKQITIATYHMLTHRASKEEEFIHIRIFRQRQWGLIIYDEVHLLPAPVFRATAEIQATRRLGLTATLVREDGCEHDVFSLVGPKRLEIPWKRLEQQGWIAKVHCTELRIPMPDAVRKQYRNATAKDRHRIAGENPMKADAILHVLNKHQGMAILIIGQYLDQLQQVARILDIPMITGETRTQERERLYSAFNRGEIRILIVSKVANFAVDLPDAAVAVQISGSFGSRQEEAQRLGRVLRPKRLHNEAYFYSLVSEDSKEQEYALKRQLFLVEQGYRYHLYKYDDWMKASIDEGETNG